MSETPEYQPEQKFGKFQSEYRDAKGNVVCVAKFEIVPEKDIDSKETTARPMLKSLNLETTDRSGKTKKIDVLEITDPHNFPIIISDEQDTHSFINGRVRAPSPQNQINLAVLFHELGHGDQISEKKFQDLDPLVIQSEQLPSWLLYPDTELIKRLNDIAELVPMGKMMVEKIPTEVIRWLENVFENEIKPLDRQAIHNTDEYQKINAEYQKICSELSNLTHESSQQTIHTLLEQRDAIEEKMFAIEAEDVKRDKAQELITIKIKDIMKKYQIAEILCLPLRLIEQDATRRAVGWLRQIRESGINLFPDLLAETKTLHGREHEQDSHTRTSITERMYEWLKSYDPPEN